MSTSVAWSVREACTALYEASWTVRSTVLDTADTSWTVCEIVASQFDSAWRVKVGGAEMSVVLNGVPTLKPLKHYQNGEWVQPGSLKHYKNGAWV